MSNAFARRLRREQTNFERKLWYELRDRRFQGFKFRRQQPIGPYYGDFVCFDAWLVVELDGSQHALPENVEADAERTKYLNSRGFRVLRFWNQELVENFEGVLESIYLTLRSGPHPSPTPEQAPKPNSASLSLKGRGEQ